MKLIDRNSYLNRLLNVKNIPDIKVITGIRRCGKSKLLDAFSSIVEQEKDANVVRIKLNQKQYEKLLNPDNLYDYIKNHYVANSINYLFIDEIQLCDGFERVIDSIHEEELFDIYITGSNAFLLSSDLATLFGGRVYEISLYPFSFREYLDYYPNQDLDAAFEKYYKELVLKETPTEILEVEYLVKLSENLDVIKDMLTYKYNDKEYDAYLVTVSWNYEKDMSYQNTIKLTVTLRRNDIQIMKYIGATDTFVRIPFIVEHLFRIMRTRICSCSLCQ